MSPLLAFRWGIAAMWLVQYLAFYFTWGQPQWQHQWGRDTLLLPKNLPLFGGFPRLWLSGEHQVQNNAFNLTCQYSSISSTLLIKVCIVTICKCSAKWQYIHCVVPLPPRPFLELFIIPSQNLYLFISGFPVSLPLPEPLVTCIHLCVCTSSAFHGGIFSALLRVAAWARIYFLFKLE